MNLPTDMQNDPKKIIGKYSVTAMFAGDSFSDKKLSDTIDTSDSLLRQLKPNETAMSVTVKIACKRSFRKTPAGRYYSDRFC